MRSQTGLTESPLGPVTSLSYFHRLLSSLPYPGLSPAKALASFGRRQLVPAIETPPLFRSSSEIPPKIAPLVSSSFPSIPLGCLRPKPRHLQPPPASLSSRSFEESTREFVWVVQWEATRRRRRIECQRYLRSGRRGECRWRRDGSPGDGVVHDPPQLKSICGAFPCMGTWPQFHEQGGHVGGSSEDARVVVPKRLEEEEGGEGAC